MIMRAEDQMTHRGEAITELTLGVRPNASRLLVHDCLGTLGGAARVDRCGVCVNSTAAENLRTTPPAPLVCIALNPW